MTEVDGSGVIYRGGFTELYSVPNPLSTVTVDPRATTIFSINRDESAFLNCRNTLKEVVFPKSSALQNIGNGTFYQCTALSTIDMFNCRQLLCIGSEVFSNCKALKTIQLPPFLEELGNQCFLSSGLENILIPKTIKILGSECFSDCSSLTAAEFEDGVKELTTISSYCFRRTKLLSFRFPHSVTSIRSYPFESVKNMKSVSIEGGENEAFKMIDNLLCSKDGKSLWLAPSGMTTETLVIPQGIEIIQPEALNSNNAKNYSFPDSITTFQGCASNDALITSLVLPDSVTTLSSMSFLGCTRLSTVMLSQSLTYLPSNCFQRTNISEIIIPNLVTSIGSYCFAFCSNLKLIELPDNIEKLDNIQNIQKHIQLLDKLLLSKDIRPLLFSLE